MHNCGKDGKVEKTERLSKRTVWREVKEITKRQMKNGLFLADKDNKQRCGTRKRSHKRRERERELCCQIQTARGEEVTELANRQKMYDIIKEGVAENFM